VLKKIVCLVLGHDWEVYSTALADACLLVHCKRCKRRGRVDDYTQAEWNAAFFAPSRPYKWEDASTVVSL
jgi:hypothetical protein